MDGRAQRENKGLYARSGTSLPHLCGNGKKVARVDATLFSGMGLQTLPGARQTLEKIFLHQFDVPSAYSEILFPIAF
jgi:hypothetical protein